MLENYEKDRLSIRGLSIQEMLDSGEYYEYEQKEHQFHQDYLSRISTLSSFGNKYMELETKIMASTYFELSDMLTKIKELYDLVLLKLNDIAQPEDVFIDSTMIWIAYRVFTKLDLVEDIDKDEFKNQFGYQNRPLTIEAKRKKKTLIAKTIYQLSQFVVPEYRVVWENKMAKHFKIKSYSKIKNKKGDSEEEFLLERMIKPFKDLL